MKTSQQLDLSLKLSKSDVLIKLAKSLGYTATQDGSIYSPLSNKLQLSKNNNGYFSFMVNSGERKQRRTVLAHRFIIYFFYGDVLFDYPLVRHLDGTRDNNQLSNLALGSYEDNRADIPKEILSNNAKKNAPLLVARMRKLSNEDVLAMRQVRKTTNWSYLEIGHYFNVSAMTAYRCINHQSWSSV